MGSGQGGESAEQYQRVQHPYLGLAGALLVPGLLLLFRWLGQQEIGAAAACTLVIAFWAAIAFLIGRESWDSVTRVRETLCEQILVNNTGLLARFCRARISNILSAFFMAVMLSSALLVFVYTVPLVYFAILFAGALVFVGVRMLAEGVFEVHVKPPLDVLTRRFMVTGLVVFVLMVTYFVTSALAPSTGLAPGSPEVAQHIKATVSHDCRMFQHLARTSAFVDYNIRALRDIPEIGGWVFLAMFVSFLSAVPMIGYVICVRFGYEALSGRLGNENAALRNLRVSREAERD